MARYSHVSETKATGATYTPPALARFVAERICDQLGGWPRDSSIRVLDPAVGDGALLLAMASALQSRGFETASLHGFDEDALAIEAARARLSEVPRGMAVHLQRRDFLGGFSGPNTGPRGGTAPFDLVIANPPYVRTQVLGADKARMLAERFGLKGRVDLYHAFLLAMAEVLRPGGALGVIVSNRFMTTRAGKTLRRELPRRLELAHIWDLGDTKLFDAAVLPAVLLARRREGSEASARASVGFTAIYEAEGTPAVGVKDAVEALEHTGLVGISDGRVFNIKRGRLGSEPTGEEVWRVITPDDEQWLARVEAHASGTFSDIGRIRVGIKTTSDAVFIRDDWEEACPGCVPELLKPLITHHVGACFRGGAPRKRVLYTHEVRAGKRRAIDLDLYPMARAYLETHQEKLEGRQYVKKARRQWFEIWVPQDPEAWGAPKVVFRDIADRPIFWLDTSGAVVNGDCYWIVPERGHEDDLWLVLAVGCSSFALEFYDLCFNNRLYSGRRRFLTQYVARFPLPRRDAPVIPELIAATKQAFEDPGDEAAAKVDGLVWRAFGFARPQ